MRITLLFFLLSCTNDPKSVQEFVLRKELPVEQIEEAELFHTQNGNIKVKIIANTINRFENSQPELILSNNLSVVFYGDSSKEKSILSSENAFIDKEKNIMIASENVVLESNDNKLETEELIWDQHTDKIYTNCKVKITTSNEVIFGEGFTSNPDFTEYTITKIHGDFGFGLE